MIDIGATETCSYNTLIDFLKYYEEDYTLWKKDFWLLRHNLNYDFRYRDFIRKKWLE